MLSFVTLVTIVALKQMTTAFVCFVFSPSDGKFFSDFYPVHILCCTSLESMNSLKPNKWIKEQTSCVLIKLLSIVHFCENMQSMLLKPCHRQLPLNIIA